MINLKPFHKYAVVTVFTLGCLGVCPAQAQNENRQFSKQAGAMSVEILTLSNAGQHRQAIDKSEQVLALPKLNAYEKSVIFQMQGASYYELNQYDEAISAFKKAMASGGLTSEEFKRLDFNVVQLKVANGSFQGI